MKKLLCAAICVLLFAVCVGCSAASSTPPDATDQPSATPVSEGSEPTPEPAPADQPEPGKYIPGTYTVKVRGMAGKFDVLVTFDAESILSIEIPEHHETENIGTRAIDEVIPAIIAAQSTEVDVVAGATITSNAIITAVDEAIAEATP
ncbi:MAG: FMN-binding protein [Christensenellales bacterium]